MATVRHTNAGGKHEYYTYTTIIPSICCFSFTLWSYDLRHVGLRQILLGLFTICTLVCNGPLHNRLRIMHHHTQEVIMDILYILKCIAYLVSIPALITMTRLFHYELNQNYRFISRHWTNKNQFSPGASAPTLAQGAHVRAYYHVHYYHHGVMWIACVCARCEKYVPHVPRSKHLVEHLCGTRFIPQLCDIAPDIGTNVPMFHQKQNLRKTDRRPLFVVL